MNSATLVCVDGTQASFAYSVVPCKADPDHHGNVLSQSLPKLHETCQGMCSYRMHAHTFLLHGLKGNLDIGGGCLSTQCNYLGATVELQQ